MRAPFAHHTLVTFIAIGLIVVSTAALSFFSYYYTVGRENLIETSLVQGYQKLALHYVELIEQKILDNDRILMEMVDVDDPAQWPDAVDAIKKGDFNVDQVYFMRPGSNYPLYPPYSHDIRNQWGRFRASFKVSEIDFETLAPNQPHHLHKERPDDYLFVTYVLRETRKGSHILVCYQMSFDRIAVLLDNLLRELQDRFYVSIVDYENNGVYNQPISRSVSPKYFFEARFRTTLYKWLLQIMPRNYTELEQGLQNQRRTNLFFVVLSMATIFFSLTIIFVVWQRDRQLRRLKEDFISNVSHELKTPLSLIRMFSEILTTNRVKNEGKRAEYYRIIHTESDRMSRLINNLLDFGDLSRGVKRKHFEKTNIAQLAEKALEGRRYEVEKDGFLLTLETQAGIPDCYADPNAITMALLNLIDNAVKYSQDEKKVDVRVACNNGFVDLSVIDRGIGIPESDHAKIFEKFYRGSAPTVRGVRGSGIGLAITKHVAEMHGGEIVVESEPGKGSAFTLRIPIRDVPEAAKP